MISRKTAEQLAYEFHGGQSSHLYSFASTGGIVWNEIHREGCRREIRAYLRWAISYLRSNKNSGDREYYQQVQEDLRLALKLDAYLVKAPLSKISSHEHFNKLYAKRRKNPGLVYSPPKGLGLKHRQKVYGVRELPSGIPLLNRKRHLQVLVDAYGDRAWINVSKDDLYRNNPPNDKIIEQLTFVLENAERRLLRVLNTPVLKRSTEDAAVAKVLRDRIAETKSALESLGVKRNPSYPAVLKGILKNPSDSPEVIRNHIAHVQDLIRTAPAEDKVKLREIVKALKSDLKLAVKNQKPYELKWD